jgi:predicted nuclease of predicted toxin-antitoxin system
VSRPRFLADHDLNEHIVVGVQRREPAIEFRRVRDIGMSNSPDAEILEYADRHSLMVVSHDVNTMPAEAYTRLAEGKTIAGLLMVQQIHPVGLIIENLTLIWLASEAEEWKNQVCFLPLL